MKTQAIAVVGSKKSGKTTATEKLIIELTKRGYKIAAIKHVSELDFTIDTPEKDTWRYAQAGAKTIISAATNEIATIEKTHSRNFSLEALLRKCRGNDVIFIEGFKKLVATKKNIPKIVVVKSMQEAIKALETYKPVLAFSGPYNTKTLNPHTPYADAVKNPKKLADIIEKTIPKKCKSA